MDAAATTSPASPPAPSPLTSASFHWLDYTIFAVSLAMGILVGVVILIKAKSQRMSREEYLLGGRNLNVVTVGASMLASAMNAIFLLGGTAEVSYR